MLPSVALRKVGKEMVGDSDYLTGLQKNLKVATQVKVGMNSHFGSAVIAALENLERASYAKLANTNSRFKWRIDQAQAELKTAQYLKSILFAYVDSVDSMEEQIKELYGDER